MIINVASSNQSKLDSVREIILDYEMLKGAEVRARPVESGVSEQPQSLDEAVQGAVNRAKAAFEDCEYSFGIEDGLIPVPQTKSGYMNMSVCCIYDGKQAHLGISSAFEYPPKATKHAIETGCDMSQAYRETGLTTHQKIGTSIGAIGMLTKGRLPRKDYTKQAIAQALIHLENPELYQG